MCTRICGSFKPCSILDDSLMASGLHTSKTYLIPTCQLPLTCTAHNLVRASSLRRCVNIKKCTVGCDSREKGCLLFRTGRRHIGAHRAVAEAGSSQPYHDIDADDNRPATRLTSPEANTSRQTYPGSAEGAQMDVLVDRAGSAHALAVVQTQRPAHPDTGGAVLCCASSAHSS